MKQLFLGYITLALILIVPPLWAQVIPVDSVPNRPSTPPFSEIGRLRGALRQNAISIDVADSLLTQARRLAYLPGQVVALCQLASIRLQQQQPQQATALFQEAIRTSEQIRDLKEVGWALGQVIRIQRMTSRFTPALSSSFAPVLESLGKAMGINVPLPGKEKDGKSFPFDQNRLMEKRMADKRPFSSNPTDYIPSIPVPGYDPTRGHHSRFNPDLVDRWIDTLIHFGNNTPQVVSQLSEKKKLRDSSHALSKAFAKEGDYAKAYQYYLQYSSYKDSLTAEATTRRLASLEYKQNLLKKEAQIQLLTKERQLREQSSNRQQQFVIALGGCVVLLVALSLILTRNNRAKHLANQQLNEQKEALQQTLAELKTTQTQLIQSEKMASLGELTAGIAHEIQNPLNFVNNFSEVSTELVNELVENRQQAHRDEELETELLNDVQQNLQKIHQHGNRASSIIKGMLEHARTTGGQKEPTDLNSLVDEYVKLAYHGVRAKDNTFEAKLTTVLDPNLGQLTVVPQEIGRVLLNLANNAFYAVQKRQQSATTDYHPEVIVSTSRKANQIEITIRDNGTGISEAIRQKIFQPFFTTKPSGQGTGLGLSLSYDIITKGHSGSLVVHSQEGDGTEFVIQLPTTKEGVAV